MSISIEEALLARIKQDQQSQMSTDTGQLIGAGLGGTAGITIGDLAQRLGATQGPKNLGQRLAPGRRFAGGLVGAILGGGLGAGIATQAKQSSPAASLLAKLQTQGDLSPSEVNSLQGVLADTYNNILGM